MRSSRFAVRPRTLLIAMVLIVAATALAVWLTLVLGRNPGRVELKSFPAGSTATVSLAGVFPAEGEEPLANPLGIVTDGTLLYVAESDAGRVRIFDSRGGVEGDIVLPLAEGRTSAYPSSLALVDDDRLAVVDNASSRVIVVSTDPADPAEVILTLGLAGGTGQPTSVAYANGEYFVFDASASAVRVYDEGGALDRTIGDGIEPRLAFAAGMAVVDDALLVADSNGGRVIELDLASGEQRAVFEDRYTLPRALVPLDDGRLAVVDTFDRTAYIADAVGARVDRISAQTVPDGPLASPRGGAWIADDGRLYVTDAGVGRVVVYNVRAE